MQPLYSRPSPPIVVEIEGVGPIAEAEVETINISLGGHSVDTAVYTVDYATRNQFILQDTTLFFTTGYEAAKIIRISIGGIAGGGLACVFRGQVIASNYDLNERGEKIAFTARTDWHLLESADIDQGDDNERLSVSTIIDTFNEPQAAGIVRGLVTFNPYVDGIALPNRAGDGNPIIENGYPLNLTVKEMLALGGAKRMQYWTLAEIVHYVLTSLNKSADPFARNPDLDALKACLSTDHNLVRHLEVDFTQPLPHVLDQVLEGYGYTWYLDHNTGEGGTSFAFVDRRTNSNIKQFVMNRYGEPPYDGTNRSEAKGINLQYDISSNAANAFYIVHGGTLVESSFELYPAWDDDYDMLEAEDLLDDSEALRDSPEKQRVWRDWILNEANNYSSEMSWRGINPLGGRQQLNDAFDKANTNFVADAGQVITDVRRKFLPMLTLDGDGSPAGAMRGGIYVEWSEDGGATWHPINGDETGDWVLSPNDCAVTPLANECGIRFSGNDRPLEEMFRWRDVCNATSSDKWWTLFKFRVTACVQGDDVYRTKRVLEHNAGRSFLKFRKPYFINCRNMRSAVVSTKSINSAAVKAGTRKAAEVDLQQQADLECARIEEVYGMASCTGTITLDGLETGVWWLGKTLLKMARREVDFQVSPPNIETARYPLVVAASFNIEQQSVTLTLDTDRTVHIARRGRRGQVGWVRPEKGKLTE